MIVMYGIFLKQNFNINPQKNRLCRIVVHVVVLSLKDKETVAQCAMVM